MKQIIMVEKPTLQDINFVDSLRDFMYNLDGDKPRKVCIELQFTNYKTQAVCLDQNMTSDDVGQLLIELGLSILKEI